MKTSFEKPKSSKNNLPNDNISKKISEIKPLKRKSFLLKKKQFNENKNKNNNKFIQVNTKRKKEEIKNYDSNKVILLQKYLKKFLVQKRNINIKYNLVFIFLQKIKRVFLSKCFVTFKKNLNKRNKNKFKKGKKKKTLQINTNIYETNKKIIFNTENTKNKEKDSSYCRTTKHNNIMNYVNYKLNLHQTKNLTNANNNIEIDLNNVKRNQLFSPKGNSITTRKEIALNKIKFKNSKNNVRNKNPKSHKIFDQFKSKTLVNNEFSNEIAYNNYITENNITSDSNIDNYNNENNLKENNSNKMHRKVLSFNFDNQESAIKEIQNDSKEINPIVSLVKNKKVKNNRNKPVKTEMNKIKKINTVFNNNNQTTKKLISKVYENCLNKDNKNKNKNKKGIKDPIISFAQRRTKTKKEFNTRKLTKKNNLNKNKNDQSQMKDKNEIKKYFKFWKENTEKKNILEKFVKFAKYLNHMNHYEKIILIKNTIQKLIKLQKNGDIFEFFWRIKKLLIINLMRKLKDYKKFNNDINNICFNTVEENFANKIKKLKILFNLIEKYNKNFNENDSHTSISLIDYFEKWKNLSIKYPKINEKIIDLKPFQSKVVNQNQNIPTDPNFDNNSLKNNLSLNKLSPKIINVINVQNYNENNNYNYNFKYTPMKDIPLDSIKPRNSYAYNKEHLTLNNNNIYHKKKLGNTYINNNYNFNFNNNNENMLNCFGKKLINNDKQKFDTYDTSSLIIPIQTNNSEIISLGKNFVYNDEHPEEKFGFKKLDKIEEKEINFLENINSNSENKNNKINKLYIRKQNCNKKYTFFKNKTTNIKAVKNSIRSLNIQFDNKNEEIIKKEKNNIFAKHLRMNKIFSSNNLFTEINYCEDKDDEDKNNKSFNIDKYNF